MNISANILELLTKLEIEKYQKGYFHAQHKKYYNPKKIALQANEIVFISNIKIFAMGSFLLSYYSPDESRQIEKTSTDPEFIKEEIASRHLGNIHFSMSTEDNYEVEIIRLKII